MVDQGAFFDGIQSDDEHLNRREARPRRGWYRGVRLQRPVSPPRTPLRQLRRAVYQAVRKNLAKLAHAG